MSRRFNGYLLLLHDDTERTRVEHESQERIRLETELIERQRAEEQLLKYRMTVEASADVITVVDSHYVYLLVNRTFLKYNHVGKSQVIGHTIAEVLGEEVFKNTLKPNLDRCLQGQVLR